MSSSATAEDQRPDSPAATEAMIQSEGNHAAEENFNQIEVQNETQAAYNATTAQVITSSVTPTGGQNATKPRAAGASKSVRGTTTNNRAKNGNNGNSIGATAKKNLISAKNFATTRVKSIKNPIKVPVALQAPDRSQSAGNALDANIYSTKKTVMTILCLIIIIMANSIQLKFVIKNSALIANEFYSTQVGLGITSVLLAAAIGFVLMYSARLNYNDAYKQRKLDYINNAIMIGLFLLCILNIFLVALN